MADCIYIFSLLQTRCDAEPGALAKYVCALVKKDKPEQDLRDICVDQLDVFLQQSKKNVLFLCKVPCALSLIDKINLSLILLDKCYGFMKAFKLQYFLLN